MITPVTLRQVDPEVGVAQARPGEATGAVAGGGLLGLEAAHAMHAMGMSVTVLERSPRLLRNFLTVNRLSPNLSDQSDPNVTRDAAGWPTGPNG